MELQLSHIHGAIGFCDTDTRTKLTNALGRVSTPSQTRNGRHSRVVPASDMTTFNELQESSLAHHGVVQIQPGEFILPRTTGKLGIINQVVYNPVIEFSIVFELESTDTMGDT